MTGPTLTYLGTHWGPNGDMFYMTHPDGNHARVYVDSLGETWVDIRRVPAGGIFHTERVTAYRALNGATVAERELRNHGYTTRRNAQYAHNVRERSL